ncbi:MAG: chromate transporter, partial [Planctomycetaceae bacterium]
QKHPLIVANPLLHLFTLFSGMSLMLFGGGFVFIPMIQGIVVQDLAWVTADEFTTALAIGQITPGPILVSATVIGFLQQGFPGGFVATVGIFLPPSLLMIMASQALESIKGSPAVQSALRGVRAAITGLILAAAVTVIQTAEPHWATALIFAASLTALLRYQLDVIWIIPSAGLLGLALL